ncbi:hypothetical protein M427DRAFT_184066 [Gonapodya prolifera JEL478]|uniref:SH3 domain-containing protein n=1 Tax=Gonapodya prolifera (strain JEL478) TaxID=1344416 RepID=A0A139A109_GONPJ|nr:hypothetical protein M427DRAFT_184066 [Gonapodya prolifera JEL478]|eukprot:KXS10308.1 hypothetical protein M427DRAFT_184066 [Gonapodya prolifera JEL478]
MAVARTADGGGGGVRGGGRRGDGDGAGRGMAASLIYVQGPGNLSASLPAAAAAANVAASALSFFPHPDFLDANAISTLTSLAASGALIAQRWPLTLDASIASMSDDQIVQNLVSGCETIKAATGHAPRYLIFLPNMVTLRLHNLATTLGYVLPGVLYDFPDDSTSSIQPGTSRCTNLFKDELDNIKTYSPDSLGGIWWQRDAFDCTVSLAQSTFNQMMSKGFTPVDVATCLGQSQARYRQNCTSPAVLVETNSTAVATPSAAAAASSRGTAAPTPNSSSNALPDPPDPSTQNGSSGPSPTVLAASIASSLAITVLLVAGLIFYRRRRLASSAPTSASSSPLSAYTPVRPAMPHRHTTDRAILRPRTPVDSLNDDRDDDPSTASQSLGTSVGGDHAGLVNPTPTGSSLTSASPGAHSPSLSYTALSTSPLHHAAPPGWIPAGGSSPTSPYAGFQLPLVAHGAGTPSVSPSSTLTSIPPLGALPPSSTLSHISVFPASVPLLPPDPAYVALGGAPEETAVRVGAMYVAREAWEPQQEDEMGVVVGEKVWVWVVYRDGWCLGKFFCWSLQKSVPS